MSAFKTRPGEHLGLKDDISNDSGEDSSKDSRDNSVSSTYVNFVQDAFYFHADYENRTPDGESCIERS
jgi:hypothetical protein